MKCLVILVCAVLSTAARSHLHSVVINEVHELISRNPSITIEDCTNQCDSLFAFIVDDDETSTDQSCASECTKALSPTTSKIPHTHHHHSRHTDAPTTVVP